MPVKFPLFILCLLIHAGIALTSVKPDRRLRLLAGLAVLFTTWPAWYGGYMLEANGQDTWRIVGTVLLNAPYYLPFMSFLVYLRGRRY